MNLTIDIGNTRTKLGYFEGDELVKKETIDQLTAESMQAALYNHFIQNCILSSVGKTAPEVTELLARGEFNRLVVVNRGKYGSVPIGEVANRQRTVPPDDDLVRAARAVGTGFGD